MFLLRRMASSQIARLLGAAQLGPRIRQLKLFNWKLSSASDFQGANDAAEIVANSDQKKSVTSVSFPTEDEALGRLDCSSGNVRRSGQDSLVIFDKDGTLICFHSMWTPWALATAERIEIASGLKSVDIAQEVYRLLGFNPESKRVTPGLLAEASMPTIRGKLTELLIIHGMEPSEVEEVMSSVWENCDTSSPDTLKSLVNLKHLFETLRKNQLKIAVCTADSREGTERALNKLGLIHLVDIIVCGDDVGAEPKPSPHNALKICRALGIDPKDAFMVGDTMADIGMGKSARLGGTIGVLSGVASEKDLEPHADHIVPSVENLLPIVLAKRKEDTRKRRTEEMVASSADHARKIREHLDLRRGPSNPEGDLLKQIVFQPHKEWKTEKNPWMCGQRRRFHTSSVTREFSKKVMARRYFAGLPPWEEKKPTHIVVGAGSAGCVMANRLSEDPENRVVLMEAGPRDDWWRWKIHMPAALMYNLCDNKYNWYYHTLAQQAMEERVMYWPRGRVWGGSSSLNAMVYIRGHPYDYDRWEREEGATGWAYRNCLPYFKKSQTHELGEDEYRGGNGPLHVSQADCFNPLYGAFIAAGQEAGYGFTSDMNGFRQEGVGKLDMTVHKGVRCSASRAYLWPILDRKNLSIQSNIAVSRILFDGLRAVGVEFTRKARHRSTGHLVVSNTEKMYCEQDVVLCGGAINSPHLLILSGVGPGDQLYNFQIPKVMELPGVGMNLQDHLEVYIQRASTKPITLYDRSSWKFPHNMIRIGMQWFVNQTGEAASSHLEAGGFVRSGPNVDHPDIQFHFLAGTVQDHGRKPMKQHAYQVHVGPMRPKSCGWIKLREEHPLADPAIQPNYLSEEDDVKEFGSCIEAARKIFAQPAFDEFRGEELLPGSQANSEQELNDFVIKHADSAYHPSCTCKMGASNDPMAVVNPETMGVYGVENLKVVDASVMPSLVSGNLNGPVIMIAEKAADIIRGKPQLAPMDVPVWKPELEKG